MKKINLGLIAHVDSGKTTLAEAMLYASGAVREPGRVDKGTAFLDNEEVEKRRGITVHSRQAVFKYKETETVLTDTPGHADLSAEMERALRVMDYAVLIISAPEGIRPRTKALWELIEAYEVPVFIFFNKMDQPDTDAEALTNAAKEAFGDAVIAWPSNGSPDAETMEQIALCDEEAMEEFLTAGSVSDSAQARLIKERKLFPAFFGSALRLDGVGALLDAIDAYMLQKEYPEEFSAYAYKIARDADNTRLTFLKVTGGVLKTRMLLPDGEGQSKINQIRFYSGRKFTAADAAYAGDICAVTGLSHSRAGDVFGSGEKTPDPLIQPVMRCRIVTKEDPADLLPYFRLLEEETPELFVTWDEAKKEIGVSVMGSVQLEILAGSFKERFGHDISFAPGEVIYKETIAESVIGAGHFEPLRHYAEVQLLLEPGERGSGLVFESAVPTDDLSLNWQRLILTHLAEKQHKGVLTGAPVTDIKITLIAGKAHLKHTEGGDFRQATYRAVRQGLMMTQNVLLEPYYRFLLELPQKDIGRAMTDLERFGASFSLEEANGSDSAAITGRAPVKKLMDYPAELAAYTKGSGYISFVPDGYDVCTDAEAVIEKEGYDPLSDTANSPDSVFCSHGAGHIVPYDEVYEHLDIPLETDDDEEAAVPHQEEIWLGADEVDAIIARAGGSNSSPKKAARVWRKKHSQKAQSRDFGSAVKNTSIPAFAIENADVLLVDAYNVIFAWEELKGLAKDSINAAADALCDILDKYASMVNGKVTAVFDAYRIRDHARETYRYRGIEVVYTAEDETADRFIERYTNENSRKMKVAVVTSDAAERTVVRGQGSEIISSAAFKAHVAGITGNFNEKYKIK